jgi:hypothetical protein
MLQITMKKILEIARVMSLMMIITLLKFNCLKHSIPLANLDLKTMNSSDSTSFHFVIRNNTTKCLNLKLFIGKKYL